MSKESISAIITTYNREDYVCEALDSVLAQTRRPDEIIVVDDASTDRTLERLQPYRKHIRLISREQNSGGHSGIVKNLAMKHATGTYYAFLDSDDLWEKSKLEAQLEAMQLHRSWGLVHTYVQKIDADSNKLSAHRWRKMPTGPAAHKAVWAWRGGGFITISSVMVKADVVKKIGGFREDPAFRTGDDYVFFCMVSRVAELGFLPRVEASYRHHANSANSYSYDHDHCDNVIKKRMEQKNLLVSIDTRFAARFSTKEIRYEFSEYWRSRKNIKKSAYFIYLGWREKPWDWCWYFLIARLLFLQTIKICLPIELHARLKQAFQKQP